MKRLSFILLLATLALFSCQKEKLDGTSKISFRLTDAPGEYDAVNVEIKGIEVRINDSLIDLQVEEGTINLLDFANGKDTLLVDQTIPTGRLNQVRLILGDNNTVVIGESVHELTTPSAQQSGLKLNFQTDLVDGIAYEYLIDFDAARSIVVTRSGKYILKPVIKVISEAVSGAISGIISPVSSKPVIYAIDAANDSLSTIADTVSGKFIFRGLATGTYKVSFIPVEPYNEVLVSDIDVKNGLVTKLDTVKLE
ncbi:MAG TPA: DUF4382 domain-containing protein [Bacteroidales bacterium]|nr:DUF4382 domain-containing protein [Bacteroidales bacterium]